MARVARDCERCQIAGDNESDMTQKYFSLESAPKSAGQSAWLSTMAALVIGAILQACSVMGPPARTPRPTPGPTAPESIVRYESVSWSRLPGWADDDVREAWPAFLKSCRSLRFRAEWSPACTAAQTLDAQSAKTIRSFFDRYFQPYAVVRQTGPLREETGLVTGYYEPLLKGSRSASGPFRSPLYAPPADLLTIDLSSLYPELKGKRLRGRVQGNRVVPYYTRTELEAASSLRGREIVWVDDALDAFLLQVQGSGRVQLPGGEVIRLQYADQNGQPYQSIGRYLVDKGELTVEQATMPGIRQWLAANPARLNEVLDANPSYVFFSEEKLADPSEGPKGAQGVPLTPGRSIAVDPASVPLGAPVFLDTTFPATDRVLQRLVIAQDTGGAIRGAVRADFFWGFGQEAGEQAGRMRQALRMWMLWPKGAALPVAGSLPKSPQSPGG
jgi:membrane-bound lytic murein transglycosylase A